MINKNVMSESDSELSDESLDDNTIESTIGEIINDTYIIVSYLDKGTFSKVWLVYDLELKKFFVAKMFNQDSIEEYKNELIMLKQYTSYDIESTTNITYVDNFDITLNKENLSVIIVPYLGKSW